MAIAAASRGKHVLTEKVMATRLEDADEMIRVAEANRVKLMVAYVTRFDPAWIALHDAIQEGAAGRPYLVAGRTAHHPGLAPWRGSWETFPMGALLSHGCHYIDQMIWNFGDIVAASSMGTNTVRGPGLAREDTATASFRFRNGMLGSYLCSWAAEHVDCGNEMSVYGTEGFLQLRFLRDGVRRVQRFAGREEAVLYEHDPRSAPQGAKNFQGECEHFIDCIAQDTEPLTNGREARKSMAAILAAYQADDEDRTVWIEPDVPYAARPGSRATPNPAR
jgi:predicted dehydrogenase